MDIKEMKDEYVFTTSQFRSIWQTFGNTFTIAISGLVIGLIMAADKYPSSGPVFVIFPLVIVGWYIMMDLQGNELWGRARYLALLEERMREETGQPFPCVESRLQPRLYSTWRYPPLWILVGAPILLIYLFSCVKALHYIHDKVPKFSGLALLVYAVCPLLSMLLLRLSWWAIKKELLAIRADLWAPETSVQQTTGGDSVPAAPQS